jgi:succinate dehydrogenase / fumarate reductase iron-sulfur subunit
MTTDPKHLKPVPKSRARVVKGGRLPVSEFAFDRPGAASPFGDDVIFPVPPELLTYEHPSESESEHLDP